MAIGGGVVVDAFDEQPVARLRVGEDAPFDAVHIGLEAFEKLMGGGLAANGRVGGGGVVPDDVVVHVGQNAVDVLGLPGRDDLAQDCVATPQRPAPLLKQKMAGRRTARPVRGLERGGDFEAEGAGSAERRHLFLEEGDDVGPIDFVGEVLAEGRDRPGLVG